MTLCIEEGSLAISVAATLYLGILPNRILQFTRQSALEVVQQSVSAPSDATGAVRAPF